MTKGKGNVGLPDKQRRRRRTELIAVAEPAKAEEAEEARFYFDAARFSVSKQV